MRKVALWLHSDCVVPTDSQRVVVNGVRWRNRAACTSMSGGTMNELRFSKAALNALAPQPDGKRACYYDDKARGLCVLVAATTKAFYVLRKVRGKTERLYVGRFPDTTVEEAGKRAARINSQIDAGVNPNELKREHRAEPTLAGLFDRYMERHARAHNRKPSNAQNNYRRYLSQWSRRKLSGITRRHVAPLHATL